MYYTVLFIIRVLYIVYYRHIATRQETMLQVAPRQELLGDDDTREERWTALLDEVNDIVAKLGDAGITKPKEALLFIRNVQYKKVGGQQLEGNCMFCTKKITSTGATRVVDHFVSQCALCPPAVKAPFVAMREQTAVARSDKKQHAALVMRDQEEETRVVKQQKSEQKQMSIRAGFRSSESTMADRAIAKFFYANAISFGAADTKPDSYYQEMVTAIQKAGPGYAPPNAKKLGGAMIDECQGEMEKKIAQRDEGGQVSDKFGITYTQDGWESCDHLPLINSAYILANDGGVYIRSVDTSGRTKNAEYIAALMIEDIYEIGCTRVILVTTDTCSTMRKAWEIVQDEFPWISIAPCQTHCPSLLLTDVGKFPEVAQTVKEETLVVGWFSNHQVPLAILRSKVRAAFNGRSKELKKAGGTRFGTNTFVGERLEEVKSCLQQTVVDPEYVSQNYKDMPDEVELGNSEKISRQHKGGTAKTLVLDDTSGGFWQRVRSHVSLTLPICKFLRRHDSSAPAVGKVYHGWFEIGQHLEGSDVSYSARAVEKHAQRWSYAHSPFFAAGYVVDPEFIDHKQAGNEEVVQGFMETLEKIGILLKVRALKVSDAQLSEQWKKRKAAIVADPLAQKQWTDYPKYPDAEDSDVKKFCAAVNAQLALFRGRKGVFARNWVMDAAKDMPAYMWWDQNGASVPELQCFARMVLAQPASASICERINSEFEFVKDRRRNRLSHEKANKLVSLFHNLRLLKRMNTPKYSEPAVGWTEDTEHSGVTKYNPAGAGPSNLLKLAGHPSPALPSPALPSPGLPDSPAQPLLK